MSGIVGAIVGSFLGVVAERVPGMVMEEEGSSNLLSCVPLPGLPAPTGAGKIYRWSAGWYCADVAGSVVLLSRCGYF
jgi:hypothetical protein